MKIIFLTLLLSLSLFANDVSKVKAKIIIDIADLIVDSYVINVYTDNPYFSDIFISQNRLKRVDRCEEANIILTKNSWIFKECSENKIVNIISTEYKDYIKHTNMDIGAFFWQKGRPNILINSKIIEKRNILIPKDYRKYLD